MTISQSQINQLVDEHSDSREYLETQISELADSHQVTSQQRGKLLLFLEHPEYYEQVLRDARKYFAGASREDLTVSVDGEWLLDNFYLVQQSLRQLQEDIRPGTYARLPKLAGTALTDYARAYAIAHAMVNGSSEPLTIGAIEHFIRVYQQTTLLTIGELWALPALLRLVNLENLAWTVNQLAELDYEHLVPAALRPDNTGQSLPPVSTTILNLRMLATQDWKAYFEAVSLVDHALRKDPAGIYTRMDFATRNRYRKAVETLARPTGEHQLAVAQAVVEMAGTVTDAQLDGYGPRKRHVGYYLIDAGRPDLERRIQFEPSFQQRLTRWFRQHALLAYLGGIALVVAITLMVVAVYIIGLGVSAGWLVLSMLLTFMPASLIAVQVVNWIVARLVEPSTLPKMDFEDGIPDNYQTFIVIPALLTDKAEIDSLVHQLELHFLRNSDPNLRFALLLDYTDAAEQHLPSDNALHQYANQQISELNTHHRLTDQPRFMVFVRERRWNPAEGLWMGWERKRGKLHEFNQLLMDSTAETSYLLDGINRSSLTETRYVITLDADTILPKGSACRLIATMAHPLNQPVFDPANHTVSAGYAVLQPRVEILPTAANQSRFTRIFAGNTSLDLYTLAVSDTYQDLFGEGTFVGKGIYDVRAFEKSLKGRVSENRLLSHDLFESLHARTALVTEITLLEDYPPHYLAHTRRLHRWIRGDWQLLPWLAPRVPAAGDVKIANYFSALDLWKMIDNLRRSLMTPALVLYLIAAWTLMPGRPLIWTLFFLVASGFAFIISPINHLLALQKQTNWQAVKEDVTVELQRWLLFIAFLPYEAYVSLDAIITTLVRLRKRRYLLQWISAAHTIRLFGDNLSSRFIIQQMQSSLATVALITLAIVLIEPITLVVASPILLLWVAAPYIAYAISQPLPQMEERLNDEQRHELRLLARRTWMFFEYYVGPHDNWLPPDHHQTEPREITAHHSSPTNIGLYLLCVLSAYDMGYIGLPDVASRLQLAFESLEKLERHRGHLLNWYDTRTLSPLQPRYVSMVDSGNFIGSLIALKQGLQQISQRRPLEDRSWQGLHDIFSLFEDVLGKQAEQRLPLETLHHDMVRMRQQVETRPDDYQSRLHLQLQFMHTHIPAFTEKLVAFLSEVNEGFDLNTLADIRVISERMRHHLQIMQRETEMLLPWMPLMANPPLSVVNQIQFSPSMQTIWERLVAQLLVPPTLSDSSSVYRAAQTDVLDLRQHFSDQDSQAWLDELDKALIDARLNAQVFLNAFYQIQDQIEGYIQSTDFQFLFNKQRKVFHIGYNVDAEKLDNSFYDLLASEARIGSLVAISLDQVPMEHWLHLGRPVTTVKGKHSLLSWSGTMFEYLMPRLLMRSYPDTLLTQSYHAVVNYHIAYGDVHGVPWGVSESGYYGFDAQMNYQYYAFGVPDVSLKYNPKHEVVISPYASLIALPIRPTDVMVNLKRFKALEALSTYGLIEAIDYTESHLPLGQQYALVEEYMAHHQGMILLALANYLHDDIFVERFHRDPRIQSVELLLQEQIPRNITPQLELNDTEPIPETEPNNVQILPWQPPTEASVPQVHYLSNGNYGLLITSTGGGYSQWRTTALTRWRADTTLEDWGTWLYICDQDSGALWSVGQQPMPQENHNCEFYPHKAVFSSQHQDITAHMEIVVSPEDDIEIRRISLTNHSDHQRNLLLSSYGEMVMAEQNADQRHPAFNKMFIEGEFDDTTQALLFHRRPRSAHESTFYVGHTLIVAQDETEYAEQPIVFETDRRQFLGRNRTIHSPVIFEQGLDGFTGTTGMTLDPIMSLATLITLEPYSTVELAYVTVAAETHPEALRLIQTYRSWPAIQQTFNHAENHAQLELSRMELDTDNLQAIQKLLSALLFPQSTFRAQPSLIANNTKSQSGLWAFGISGDYPIIVVAIHEEDHLALVQDLLLAHMYWRNRQIKSTLVILNQRDSDYSQALYNQVHRLITRLDSATWLNRHDGIFIVRGDQLNDADHALLAASARVFLDAVRGTLAEQIAKSQADPVYLPAFSPAPLSHTSTDSDEQITPPDNLLFDNGYGGFLVSPMEYIIYGDREKSTPAPWINVVANPEVGFTVSEAGGGFSWAINSGENRLTAWRNDPVIDMPSEIVYLRDEETGLVWTPTPLPAGDDSTYLVHHGPGYSTFEHHSYALKQTLTMFVVPDDPVKIIRLRLENTSDRQRRITATYYAEWVLGPMRDITQQYLVPSFEQDTQTLFVRNPYNLDFGNTYMFVSANKAFHGLTANRTEFLGRLGNYEKPAALGRIGLGATVEPGHDTCAAVQLHVDLGPEEIEEIYFIVGGGVEYDRALSLVRQYRDTNRLKTIWDETVQNWQTILKSVEVQTPSQSMNVILPWLLYQALSCRIWGRSALYQSSGAYGFRDQLQDVMALIHTRPDVAREHILRAAAHQFEAGDVLHWWHPPSGRGVRTRFSDDLIWLPYVTEEYVTATGDTSILEEQVPFKKGAPLEPEEEERYGYYETTSETFSLYEHCLRALDHGLTAGVHQLPLMGAGDWNDGMNRVGIEGRGESVWVGWFLYKTISDFLKICEHMDDQEKNTHYRDALARLQSALETHAWDGKWYRRAYYDDGTPLGSSSNLECQIDSIAQSWGVLSGAASPERAQQAMASVRERLIRPEDRLLLLFTPPFDQTEKDPGYIKGYPPGVRENGGQYTHAAIWTVWALAKMGEGDYAESLFQLLNPVLHSDTLAAAKHYRVEPYVVAADVYSAPAYTGRGGWTWYTGSSGWLYRLGIEALLGIRREGYKLYVEPAIPSDWRSFSITYHCDQATYHIEVKNPDGIQQGVQKVIVDGEIQAERFISLTRDAGEHHVTVLMGETSEEMS